MHKMLPLALIPLLLLVACAGERVTYDDYQVYSLYPSTLEQLQSIHNLRHEFDVWKLSRDVKEPSDVMVSPERKESFHNFLKKTQIPYEIKINNVQSLINDEAVTLKTRTNRMDWTNYHSLDEIYGWLDELCKNYTFVKCIVGGISYEKRELKGIEITFGKDLTGVFIEAGIHAREWISPASTTWMINEILKSPKDSIFRQYNYIYFPLFNPDGYVHSWKENRLWRKTRTPYVRNNITYYGADPNRNWDHHWNEIGTSSLPSSEIFAGSKPFSEIEMKTMSEYISSIIKPKKIDIYLAYHSYSQMLLYPWGYKEDPTPHDRVWSKLGNRAGDAIEAVHNTVLRVGQSSTVIYPTSGSSDDWVYGLYNITVCFVFEMRDRGRYGFVLPPEQILPNSEEYFAGVKTILTDYKKLNITL